MMENRYQWLSPRGGISSGQERCLSGQFKNSTFLSNYSVSRTSIPGMSRQLPLIINYENSSWDAGKACANLIVLYDETDCGIA